MCVQKCFSSFSSSRIVCICYAMPGFPLYFFSRVVQLAFTIFLRDTYTKPPSILWNVPANIQKRLVHKRNLHISPFYTYEIQ